MRALPLGLAGLLSIVAGVLLFGHPFTGAFGLAVILGAYTLVYGLVLIISALGLRSRAPIPVSYRIPRDHRR